MYITTGAKLICSDMVLNLPVWVQSFLEGSAEIFPTVEEHMLFVIELARLNVDRKTGGPFGAGIFERKSGRLIAVGVNQVESSNCSIAHAEMLAIALAQKAVGTYDLGGERGVAY